MDFQNNQEKLELIFIKKLVDFSLKHIAESPFQCLSDLKKMNNFGVNSFLIAIEILELDPVDALSILVRAYYRKTLGISLSKHEEDIRKEVLEISGSKHVMNAANEIESKLIKTTQKEVTKYVKYWSLEILELKVNRQLYSDYNLFNKFRIRTLFDCEKDYCRYFYHIYLLDESNRPSQIITPSIVNYPRSLGMLDDSWCFLSEETVSNSVKDMIKKCKYLLKKIEIILQDLLVELE